LSGTSSSVEFGVLGGVMFSRGWPFIFARMLCKQHPLDLIPAFPFQPEEGAGYNLFPAELEQDEHTFFHGTSEAMARSIAKEGFKPRAVLTSSSFSEASGLALGYACRKRSDDSPNGCVLAVRVKSLDSPWLRREGPVLYLAPNTPRREQPALIGRCVVPSGYEFR